MTIIAFKVAQDRAPTLLTIYGVQTYWSDRGRLAKGRLQEFPGMESALRAGQDAAKRAPAVRVFRVSGNQEADYWERPITVAKFGERASELAENS